MLNMATTIGLLILTVLSLIKPFVHADLSAALFFVGLATVALSFRGLKKTYRKTVVVFIIAALCIFWKEKLPFEVLIEGGVSLLSISAILVIMQLFNLPLAAGEYKEAIGKSLKRLAKSERRMYAFVSAIMVLLTSFLASGSIPMVYSIFSDTIDKMISEPIRFKASLLNPYSLPTMWTPSAVSIALIIEATGIRWSELFFPALILSLIGYIWVNIIAWKWLKRGTFRNDNAALQEGDKESTRKIIYIVAAVAALLTCTFLLEQLKFSTATNRVMICGFLVSLGWAAFYIRKPGFKSAVNAYFTKNVILASDTTALFFAMGIFAKTVEHSSFVWYLQYGIKFCFDHLGVLTLLMISLSIFLLSMIGIHPLISVILLGSIIKTANHTLAPAAIALAMSSGGAISYAISPFAGVALMMSNLIGIPATELSFKYNRTFCLSFFVIAFVYVLCMNAVLQLL